MSITNENHVKDTLYNNCSLVAAKSGDELVIYKDGICGLKEGSSVSIFKLFSSIRKFTHEDDYAKYDRIFETERVAAILSDNSIECIDQEFQLKPTGSDSYTAYQFAIVRDEVNALIILVKADRFYNVLENAMKLFSFIMERVLKVNVTKDTFKEIRRTDNLDHPDKLSDWIKKFAECNIAQDDQKDFLDYFNKIVDGTLYRSRDDRPAAVVYRRCINTAEYRWSIMYAIPTKNYTNDNKEMYFYTIDIQDHYIIQAQRARRLGTDMYYDAETGLHNKRAYENRIARLHGQKVSLAWIGLREETPAEYKDRKSYVKSTVDMIVDEYGEDRCYRINETEFVVLNVGSHKLDTSINSSVMFGVAYANGEYDYGELYDTAVKNATW